MSQNKKEKQPDFKVGGTIWPSVANVGGNASEGEQEKLKQLIIQLAEYVAQVLEQNGIARFAFPLFRPFNAVFAITQEKVFIISSPLAGGIAILRFLDWRDAPEVNLQQAIVEVQRQLGWHDISSLEFSSIFLSMSSQERQPELRELAQNLTEQIKTQIMHAQRKVTFNPIFRTPIEELETDPNLCFVLMPFRPEFNRIYEEILKPVIQKAGLKSLRADEVFSPTPIVEDVWIQIAKARFIIADVTDKNPNVFYELGLAHAIGTPVIIITQNKGDVPFDIAYIRYLIYTDNEAGWQKLKNELTKAVSSIIAK
jgi:hypothetical protein